MNHTHILYDSDPHFKIDTVSRSIINESSKKTKLVQHDHNSERFTFEMARHIEGHDMASCNLVEVHYLNIESNTKIVHAGVYTVDDLQIKADDENSVVCSWLIPNNATQLVGQLQFLLRFACVNDANGKVEYVWNTSPYTGITISSGIYNTDTASDNPVPAYNFVTTVNGDTLKFFVGTKAEYHLLPYDVREGLFAIITDDTTKADMENSIAELEKKLACSTSTGWKLPSSGVYHIRVILNGTEVGTGNSFNDEVQDFGLVKWYEGEFLTKVGRRTWFSIAGDGTFEITNTGGGVMEGVSTTYEITKWGE